MSEPVLVYAAGVAWDGVEGTDHRLVEFLSQEMTTVWIDPPMPVTKRLRQTREGRKPPRAGLHQLGPMLWRLHTVAPPGVTRPIVRSLVRAELRLAYRQVAQAFTHRPRVGFTSHPSVNLREIPCSRRVFHVTDDFLEGASLLGLSKRRLQVDLEANLQAADVVLAVSPRLASKLADRGRPVRVLPNGCDPGTYARAEQAPWPVDVHLQPPIAGVVGQLNERIDVALLDAVADSGASLLLVGPRYEQSETTRQRLDRLIGRPNVQWVGRKKFDELPSYLAVMTVGLTPYVANEFNRSSAPLKTLEYLSAGRPVVSTPLPGLDALDGLAVDAVADPHGFAQAVEMRLAAGVTPEVRAACRAIAERNSWESRAAELSSVLRGTVRDPRCLSTAPPGTSAIRTSEES